MASRIQGITVEIGGDTTKLSKALESVNKSIKGTQSGLKDVNKLLKLDPSNTELVVQKQKMLKDAIEATKEKLATLKTAAQQANEQLANGEITQQQYDALQREIVETEQNLRSLQDQAATTNATLAKIDEAGEKLQNIGSSVENVGKKFLPVTAAVTGLGTAAVKTAADFDSEMSKVSAISGATGDDFDQLRAKAREMGAKTKFSASEAASAMEYMAMAGWKTGDMLNGIEGIMNLAAASGEDLATTSDIVTDALTAFGLSAADSGHFADILAAASSNANTNVSMMGETFKYCAPIAGALGFSAEDTAEAIGLMANSGIKASQAGTSLRTIMNNLSGEVTFVGKNIGEVTIATSNADGSMRSLNDILADCRVAFSGLSESEKAANAEALVGKNAMSGFLALMNSSEKDINKLRGAIENCDGASESMAETILHISAAVHIGFIFTAESQYFRTVLVQSNHPIGVKLNALISSKMLKVIGSGVSQSLLPYFIPHLCTDGDEQFFFRQKIFVHRCRADICSVCHFLQADSFDSVLREQSESRFDQLIFPSVSFTLVTFNVSWHLITPVLLHCSHS